MKLRYFLLGVVTGLATAIIIKETTEKVSPYMSANQVLENIKQEFKKESSINGSWILMKTELFKNGLIELPVYRGGISRIMDGINETYEFAADASTGVIIELVKV